MSHEWKHQPLAQSFIKLSGGSTLSILCLWWGILIEHFPAGSDGKESATWVVIFFFELLTEDLDILCASWWRATAPVLPLGLLGPPHNLATESGNVCHSKRPPRLCSSIVTGNCCDCSVADYHLSNILKFSPGGRYLVEGGSHWRLSNSHPSPQASLVISPSLMSWTQEGERAMP